MAAPHVTRRYGEPPLENGDNLTREEFHRRYEMHPEIKKAELINGIVYMDAGIYTRGSKGDGIPPLENGDNLGFDEFNRRYEAHPEIKKAELIEGVVYVASPVRIETHGDQDALMGAWLRMYQLRHPELQSASNVTVKLRPDQPQPDALLRRRHGGTSHIDDGYVVGPPELVVEIAASSASYDRHQKMRVYAAAGVREYILWRVYDDEITWFELEDGEYRPLMPGPDGLVESPTFPGLRLHIPKMLEGDLSAVVAALR